MKLGKQGTRVHYAWVVCFGCALMFFCTCGLSCNVFSVYSPFIMEARNFTKTQMSVIISVRSLLQMCAIFLTGKYYKKLKLRSGMLLAGFLCVIGYVLYGLAVTFPSYLLGSAFVGLGYGLGAMVPISMVLEQWFVRDRTLAVSLVSAASGLASIGIPSVITALIQRFSMQSAFFIEAGFMSLLVLLSYLIIRNNPGEMSIGAFGEKEEKRNAEMQMPVRAGTEGTEAPKRRELSEKWWVLLCFMVVLSTSFNAAGYSHLALLCSTEGYPAHVVALALSVCGGMLMAGKFVFGIMSTRLSLFRTSMIFGVCCIISTFLCCLVRIGTGFLFFATGLFGFSLTVVSVGMVAWATEWAKPGESAKRVRMFQLVYAFGGLVMSLLPGIMADAAGGSYIPFYFLSGCLCIVVVVIVWLTYRKLRPLKKEGVQ